LRTKKSIAQINGVDSKPEESERFDVEDEMMSGGHYHFFFSMWPLARPLRHSLCVFLLLCVSSSFCAVLDSAQLNVTCTGLNETHNQLTFDLGKGDPSYCPLPPLLFNCPYF